ncbi:hypothetical protein SB717_38225, partial [Priestia sp. SIMBA_032]|uniref:hypothetical protein n=1 Tax=Priestia sp. SIMBA_032 TaxID=3085775 RepID=UPI00397BA6B7
VFSLTLLLTIGVSAASYAWIEEPTRQWLREREARAAAAGAGPETLSPKPVPQADQPPRHIDREPRHEYDRQQSR